MNILIVTDTLPPVINGVNTVLVVLLKHLETTEHKVVLIGPRQEKIDLKEIRRITIYTVRKIRVPFYKDISLSYLRLNEFPFAVRSSNIEKIKNYN